MTVEAAPTTGTPALPKGEVEQRRGVRVRDYGILAALIAIVVALSLSTDTFLTSGTLVNLFDQVAVVGLLATGATV